LGRGGQVFYLLNRISQLNLIERKLKRLVPEAHFTIIHGKMSKDQIEEAINDFIDRRYDILICTTIIETGIDIPNANTIIIEKADILGLAQLYQIRGRVGRSDRIAYAYLMYDKGRILTESAQKRLDTIKEFTALGSGYKIAMRDLSIRGAGDILGSEQSGFIDAVGIELYLKMLNEAIQEEKGLVVKEDKKQFDVRISKHINEAYVSDDIVRIEMHKSINKVKSREEAENIRREFADRYGKITQEIDLYIEGKYLTFLLKSKGVASFKESDKKVDFHFDQDRSNQITYKDLQRINTLTNLKLEFGYKNYQIYITIHLTEENKNIGKDNYIYQLTKLLENV
jgi:transcription-repair coupling factor (superfamily II helicase)